MPYRRCALDLAKELRSVRLGLEAVLRRMDARLGRPVAVSVADAAQMLGLGATKFRQLLKRREVSSFLVDRRRLVRVQELEDWALRQSAPVSLRFPKTKGKTEGEKVRAALRG